MVLGATLGKYEIVAEVGQGGMGMVYLAKHTLIGSKAAVKILRPDFSKNEQVVDRFFNEARAAASIRHPGIVDIYDFGRREDGSAFIVMECLEGESLQERLQRTRVLSAEQSSRFTRQAAAALAAAHKQGIVHRDLKPDNMFLCPDDSIIGGERVKILDFGIAKLAPNVRSKDHKTTVGVMGTPTYMSPEQCRGAGLVDHRSDIYSLGCVMFEMACGRAPFVAEGMGELIAMHLTSPPPDPQHYAASLPPALATVIKTTLAKDPDQRYQSMDDFAKAIDGATGGRLATSSPVAAPGAGPHRSQPGMGTDPTMAPSSGVPVTMQSPGGQSGPIGAAPRPATPGPGPAPAAMGATPTPSPVSVSTLSGAASQYSTPPAQPRSKAPYVLAGVISVAAIAAIAVFAMQKGDSGTEVAASEPAPASDKNEGTPDEKTEAPEGEAPAADEADKPAEAADGDAPVKPGTTAEEKPAVPETVSVRITSRPSGATVTDVKTGEVLGKTPLTFDAEKSTDPRALRVALDKHEAEEIEIIPDRAVASRVALIKSRTRTSSRTSRRKRNPDQTTTKPARDKVPTASDKPKETKRKRRRKGEQLDPF